MFNRTRRGLSKTLGSTRGRGSFTQGSAGLEGFLTPSSVGLREFNIGFSRSKMFFFTQGSVGIGEVFSLGLESL